MFNGLPVVLICGDGGSGKDTVAAMVKDIMGLPYRNSTSYTAAEKMWPVVQEGGLANLFPKWREFKSLADFYEQRAFHRRAWAAWIDWYNSMSDSGALLYQDSVSSGNHIITGVRKIRELEAFLKTDIPDLAIWVDRPGVPRDPTQEYGPELCDLVLQNDGDLQKLNRKIRRTAMFFEKFETAK